MNILGIYIFNADRNAWLQDTVDPNRTLTAQSAQWGSFNTAREFLSWDDSDAAYAEEIREKVSGDESTYTMQAMQ